jgi:hypothetical protein
MIAPTFLYLQDCLLCRKVKVILGTGKDARRGEGGSQGEKKWEEMGIKEKERENNYRRGRREVRKME